MKNIINCSNLHVGGGIQVAVSFIDEIKKLDSFSSTLEILASTDVDKNLSKNDAFRGSSKYKIFDSYGLTQLFPSEAKRFSGAKNVFTIFGPLYLFKTPFKSIVGFAQPWIIYPNNECYAMMTWFERRKLKLKFWIQGIFFKRADILVVELEHAKAGLIRELGVNPKKIKVIHNTVSSIYLDESTWQPVSMPKSDGYLNFGFLGRNYLHKNTKIFPEIVRELKKTYGIKARIYVTFTDEEWSKCSQDFHETCINVGPLSVYQCPMFYNFVDAVIFPSLLEMFSATPFEAFVMKKPLFASDRPFNRDICNSFAHYFDPMNANDAAQVIASYFSNRIQNSLILDSAREHALNFSSSKIRAQKYLQLFEE